MLYVVGIPTAYLFIHWNCVTNNLVAFAKSYAELRTSCMQISIDGFSFIWIECCKSTQSFCNRPVFWFSWTMALRIFSLAIGCGQGKILSWFIFQFQFTAGLYTILNLLPEKLQSNQQRLLLCVLHTGCMHYLKSCLAWPSKVLVCDA